MTDLMPAEYIAKRAGTRLWVLAPRLTARLKAKGYECAIPRKTWDAWQTEWRRDIGPPSAAMLAEALRDIVRPLTYGWKVSDMRDRVERAEALLARCPR